MTTSLPQAAAVLALALSAPWPAPAAAQAPASAVLERALEAVSADGIRSDLHFIASDEMAGRDTPSQEQRIAARFIRARLQRLGFTPCGDTPETFFHTYELEEAKPDLEATGAVLAAGEGEHVLAFGADYYFHPSGIGTLDATGPMVWVGDAAAATVEGLDLTGKWAVAADSDAVTWRERQANVLARGAIGVLVVSLGEDEFGGRAPRIKRWLENGSNLRVVGGGVVPHVYLAHSASRHLFDQPPAVGAELPGRFTDRRRLAGGAVRHTLENVAGLWPGSDPELSKEVLIVSAHYDHVGTDGDKIYNGADDNGSGTCGMLAIAEALHAYGPMRRSVLLLWVSGEEKNLLGSAAWTEDPTLPPGLRPVVDLNIDMIGRNAPDYLLITPTANHPAYNALTRMAEAKAPLEGFPELGDCDSYWQRSDHANFSSNLGIPVAFLFSDVHEDYHEPTDTPDKIDYDKVRRVSRLVVRMLDGLQGDTLDL